MNQNDTEWTEVESKTVVPPHVIQGRALLLRLQKVIQALIDKDQKQIALLREQQHRKKHGGGA